VSYAPGGATLQQVEAIVKHKKGLTPVAVYLEGEYGLRYVFVREPVLVGGGVVERIIEVELSDDEHTALERSAAAVEELVQALPPLEAVRA